MTHEFNHKKETETATPYTQICVWQATTLDGSTPIELESFFMEAFNTRIRYIDEVDTTAGPTDLLFYVHSDDIPHFAVPRLKAGIRWWEDVVVYNDHADRYSAELLRTFPPTW